MYIYIYMYAYVYIHIYICIHIYDWRTHIFQTAFSTKRPWLVKKKVLETANDYVELGEVRNPWALERSQEDTVCFPIHNYVTN